MTTNLVLDSLGKIYTDVALMSVFLHQGLRLIHIWAFTIPFIVHVWLLNVNFHRHKCILVCSLGVKEIIYSTCTQEYCGTQKHY